MGTPAMTRVLVTDGDERAALAVTRALGGQGVEVIVGAEKQPSLAATSKYCARSVVYPPPHRDPSGFLDCLHGVLAHQKVDALFPISDIAMHVIGPNKSEFERHTRMPIPDHRVFEAISDKYNLMRLAQDLDVAIPDTIFVPDGNIQPMLDGIASFRSWSNRPAHSSSTNRDGGRPRCTMRAIRVNCVICTAGMTI
jgi:predicted ATP-grasp superfamily ATP-dependent carboligase